ncbi:uncharacterized protein LOC119612411 isoform X2 [Lucilia sericata]|uniref:uncharacterized protein LOC119612411 isoform X2 n=1 Tax=Lucilia sericata TaxID=13632 RepID=UPI0018A82269|nr:uncharacterized protein LOC119612411 isoform X2 [Lucilia sericata]
MDSCLLCLRNPIESNQYIPVQSPQWIEWQVLNIIEKHFWPMVNLESIYGICQSCWSHLYEFHLFYCTVEEAHLNNVQINKQQQTFYNFEKETPHILKVESLSNEPLIFINDEIITDSKIEENFKKELFHYNVEMETIKETVSKKKRGRPSKSHGLKKPKGKVGRPRKVFKEISELPSTSDLSDIYPIDLLCNKKPKGKVGRPRKYFKEMNDFPSTSHSLIRNGTSAMKIYAMGAISGTNKKPKGKVGRPRKFFQDINDFSSTNKSLIENGLNVKKMYAMCPLETNNSQYIKPKKRGRPFKKKYIQENETINYQFSTEREDLAMEESLIPEAQLNTDCSEEILNHAPLNDNDLQKNKDLKNILKNHKRIQQHKSQMRNYIATSILKRNFK